MEVPATTPSSHSDSLRLGERFALGGVLCLAATLAVWGAAFGLPHVYTPDEPAVVGRAMVMARSGDLNPHFFTYPHLVYDLQAALVWTTDHLVGWLPDLSARFPAIAAPGAVYLAARLLGAACATLAVACTYGMSRDLASSRPTGLLAALYLAVAPLFVQHAHYGTVDMPSAAATSLCGYACLRALRIARGCHTAAYSLLAPAAVAAGLAAGTKYNAALVVLCPLLGAVVLWARAGAARADRLLRGLAGLVAALGGILVLAVLAFLVTTPYALLDWRHFLEGLQGVALHYGSTGHPGAEGNDNWRWYLAYLATTGVALPLLALAIAGMGVAVLRRRAGQAIVAAFCLAYYALLCTGEVRFERNLLPVLPFLAVLAAVTTRDLWEAVQGWWGRTAAALVVGAVAAGVALPPLAGAVRLDVSLTHTFTQDLARDWLVRNVPPGSTLATENWEAPPVPPHLYRIVHVAALGLHDAAWYWRHGAGYVVADSWTDGAYLNSPARYPAVVVGYEALYRCGRLLATIRGGDAHPGPDFTVYRLPAHGCGRR
jgi:4-amino-4-deoxy-L-arabinose transferase-like glycosyltransferase